MTTAQKVIKYLAIAFAIFLIINIISGILWAIFGASFILGLHTWENDTIREHSVITNYEYSDVETLNREIETLDIDIKFNSLIIKTGSEFKVEGDSNNIKCRQDNKTIHIEETNHHWFQKNNSGEIIIYIPEDLEFDKVKISTGAGKIDIERLKAKRLSLEIGAGETNIKELEVKDKAEIDGGAGKVTILSGIINDLDLDMGVGKVELNAKLTGSTDIDAGIGELAININAPREDYKIRASKGIGAITIDKEGISNDTIYGNGENYIKIDGGIGSIRVNFK